MTEGEKLASGSGGTPPTKHHAGRKIMQGIEEERSRVGQGGLWMLQ